MWGLMPSASVRAGAVTAGVSAFRGLFSAVSTPMFASKDWSSFCHILQALPAISTAFSILATFQDLCILFRITRHNFFKIRGKTQPSANFVPFRLDIFLPISAKFQRIRCRWYCAWIFVTSVNFIENFVKKPHSPFPVPLCSLPGGARMSTFHFCNRIHF